MTYTPKQMSDTILRLLEQYQRRRERDQQRGKETAAPESVAALPKKYLTKRRNL